MSDNEGSPLIPPPSPEQRRAVVAQYERAQQVTAKSDFDYAIQLLISCCKIDPAELNYRRYLRQVEKAKYKNNLYGSKMALITASAARQRLKSAKRSLYHVKVLELGEEVLTYNPWDTGVQLDMAESADALGLLDVAIWILEQSRQKDPKDVTVNRALARLYEKRGNFNLAIKLWELVREADPKDVEARSKSRDLAATDTISRGQYEQALSGEAKLGGEQAAPVSTSPRSSGVQRVVKEADVIRARIKNDPSNPSSYLALAAHYRRFDQFDDARGVLVDGVQATGNNFDVSLALSDLDIELFRRDLAQAEERLKGQPDDRDLVEICEQLRREVMLRELEIYRAKADRYPNEKAHRLELGACLLRAGQVDEAIKELQPLRADPRFQWQALMYLGYCFKNRNNWRLAQRNFEDALQNLPPAEQESRKDILFQLAEGHAGAGDLAKAMDIGHELANLDFTYRNIGQLIDDWQKRLEDA